jgi:hypothetical protein
VSGKTSRKYRMIRVRIRMRIRISVSFMIEDYSSESNLEETMIDTLNRPRKQFFGEW